MKTDPNQETGFSQTVVRAVRALKSRLQKEYERAFPELAEIIHLVLDEEETNAWKFSFPHLFLPDLVEAHIAKLNLAPVNTRRDELLVPHEFAQPGIHPGLLTYASAA